MNISPHDFLQLVASFPPGRLVELRYELACQVSMIITRWRPRTFDMQLQNEVLVRPELPRSLELLDLFLVLFPLPLQLD